MQLRSNFKMTKSEWNRLVSQFIKPTKSKQRKAVTNRKSKFYEISVGAKKETVRALTKSEARAKMKEKLGLSRLPAGTTVTHKKFD